MNKAEAMTVAVRALTKEYREVKRNVMADPRAVELRAGKLLEMEAALEVLACEF